MPPAATNSDTSVTIGLQDLITMSSDQIARRVVDELRIREIAPIHVRLDGMSIEIQELRTQLSTRVSWVTGAKDALLKMGWLALAIIEARHYLFH